MQATFLLEEQIWGDKALGVFDEYGRATSLSDLAVILGGVLGGSARDSEGNLAGAAWSASSDSDGYVRSINGGGVRVYDDPCRRNIAARPALPSSETSAIRASAASPSKKIGKIAVITYGEYPQEAVNDATAKQLESALNNGALGQTGKKYTFDREQLDKYDTPFKPTEYPEYTHNGKRYIRIQATPYDNDSALTDGRKVEAGCVYWIEVQPIEWLVDATGLMLARRALFAGVQFDSKKQYDGDFAKTDIKKYLDKYFIAEMQASRTVARINDAIKTTLLKEEQIWGDAALDVIKEYGVKTAVSDLVVALGSPCSDNKTSDGDRSGYIWSASSDSVGYVRSITSDGDRLISYPSKRSVAARPALPSSVTSLIRPSAARPAKKIGKTEVITFGEYPQTSVNDQLRSELESLLNSNKLSATGKKYTFDGEARDAYDKPLKPDECAEYEYRGKKYIRVIARPYRDDKFNDGTPVESGKGYWFEVEPIEWLRDKSGWWVSRVALFGGIQLDKNKKYDGDFEKTDMKKYLDMHFSREMQDVNVFENVSEREKFTEAKRKLNHGVTVIDEPMSVGAQIDFYIKTGKSFMLHGPSGVGKTARVESTDPDLTAVPLWNGVLPEDIVGKVRYPNGQIGLPEEFLSELTGLKKQIEEYEEKNSDTGPTRALKNPELERIDEILKSQPKETTGGVWVAPDWYTELVKKCNAEPSRQHVLFIDEVTNAKPTTQSLIFHIVLKKSISPSKGKLPANAVVVLAGNDKLDSGAAYNMPAPLFRRMSGHIYLKTNLPEWLEWASEKSRKHSKDPNRLNAHPLVAQFLAKYPEAFYSQYDEENPPAWAIDPRGWEQISDIIYDNGNTIRRELIENKIGRENAAALLAFAREPMLTLDDVLAGNFGKNDIPETMDARLAVALGMRHVNDRHVGVVREFIGQHLGAENLAIFDSKWAENNPERAIQIGQMTKFRVTAPTQKVK